jgi:2'-hydroxyisoflavone reductase
MTSRREMLKLGAGLAAASAVPYTRSADAASKTLLVLGGTGFIGPHLTTEAMRLGWKVTHFNRGKRDADGVPGVETLLGDRKGQLDSLKGRKWDAVVDNTGYIPKFVKQSAELLAPNAGYCLFVSSISAYASFAKPNDESSPTGKLEDINFEEVTNDSYGPMKALCEQYSMDAFKGRASVVRPGYIVGPLDPTDRFTYWPVRVSKGGEMLAPGTPKDPIQIIDVRDLTAWMMKLVEARTTGYFNAITPARAHTLGDIIAASEKESPKAGTKVTWVPEDFLLKQWKPEEVDVPPWSPMKGDYAAASLTSAEAAVKSGLKFRSMDTTVHDTMEWFRTLPAERQAKLRAGISPEKEAETLRAWHESKKA